MWFENIPGEEGKTGRKREKICALNVKINKRKVSYEFGGYVRQVNGAGG